MTGEQECHSLAQALASLKDVPNVDSFLVVCPRSDSAGTPELRLLFPRFKEDTADVRGLAECLWLNAINYAIPVRKRRLAQLTASASQSGADMTAAVRLVAEARRAFIEYNEKFPNRASEVGELLAYTLAIHLLDAVQLASKMALKTSANMPVHGLDGVHASFDNGLMTLYFLESKMAGAVRSGIGEYAKSVAKFGSSRKQYLLEYQIMSDLGNLSALPDDMRHAALEYLDIYGSKRSKRLERSVGVICYSETGHFAKKLAKQKNRSPSDHEADFQSRYSLELPRIEKMVRKYLEEQDVDPNVCYVFVVAVPDVDELRKLFYESMK